MLRGGVARLPRADLTFELQYELAELRRYKRRHLVDRELHDAYASTSEFMETHALHGHRQMQWTKNAIIALERERNRLLAHETAQEVTDQILDWMLEGWYFGERKSDLPVLGYVPSIKKDGPIRPHEAKKLVADKYDGALTLNKVRTRPGEEGWAGGPEDKLGAMQRSVAGNVARVKAAREGTDVKHQLEETQNALTFGLFMLTMMYFRAQSLLRRDADALSGRAQGAALSGKGRKAQHTTERGKMLEEGRKFAARTAALSAAYARAGGGERRKAQRLERERVGAQQKLRAKLMKKVKVRRCVTQCKAVSCGGVGGQQITAFSNKH